MFTSRIIIPLKAGRAEGVFSASSFDEARERIRKSFEEKLGKKEKGEKKYGRNTEEIIAWILLEPEITMLEIAQRIDKSQSTVEKVIRKLREDKIVERIRSTKAGHWKVHL